MLSVALPSVISLSVVAPCIVDGDVSIERRVDILRIFQLIFQIFSCHKFLQKILTGKNLIKNLSTLNVELKEQFCIFSWKLELRSLSWRCNI